MYRSLARSCDRFILRVMLEVVRGRKERKGRGEEGEGYEYCVCACAFAVMGMDGQMDRWIDVSCIVVFVCLFV